MHIWMVNATDAIPEESFGYKRGMDIARVLSEAGHSVSWLVPSFAHALKEQRPARLEMAGGAGAVTVHSIPTCAYEANVSIARLRSYWHFGRGLLRIADTLPRPDAILAVLPTPFADVACARLARRFRVPLIGDFRDLWPELFAAHVPRALRWLTPALLAPWFAMRSFAMNRMAALISVNEHYRAYLLEHEPGLAAVPTHVIYDGIDARVVADERTPCDIGHTGLVKASGEMWAVYAGMLSDHHDVATLCDAAHLLHRRGASPVRILVLGKGPMAERVAKAAQEVPHLDYLGVVSIERLRAIYQHADIGLVTCAPTSTVVLPAKFFDYLGAALPMVSSVPHDCHELMLRYDLGVGYRAGDAESLADALSALAADASAVTRLSYNVRRAARDFNRHVLYQEFAPVIARAIIAAPARSASGTLPSQGVVS